MEMLKKTNLNKDKQLLKFRGCGNIKKTMIMLEEANNKIYKETFKIVCMPDNIKPELIDDLDIRWFKENDVKKQYYNDEWNQGNINE